MAQLRLDFDEFKRRGVTIVVAGPEGADAFEKYFRENDLPFVGIPDPAHSILKKYGQEVNLFRLGRMPAQVVVDRAGVARFAHYGHDMSDIPSNAEVLALIDGLDDGTL
jgi:peroxiredoxin